MNRCLPILSAVALVAACVGVARGDFRVQPYLQNPSSDGMYFTWFSSAGQPGSLAITGPGLASPLTFNTTPDNRTETAYTPAEINQNIPGLAQGSWLVAGGNFKHTVNVSGLQPDTVYTYTATQGGQTFSRTFKTAPTKDNWSSIRFVAMADSETEPTGRVTRREWAPGAGGQNRPSATNAAASPWATKFGVTGNNGVNVLRYAMTETDGYTRNLQIVDSRNPDFIMKPGDLVQGAGYQPGWDEFFRHNAGEFGDTFTKRPVLPAYGNWETFAAINGGYGTGADRSPVVKARHRYKTYFDLPSNGTAAHQDNYYRVDYGPLTVITLDSTKGAPDDLTSNYPAGTRLTGQQYTGPGTDTQSSFNSAEYATAAANLGLVNDLSPYNPGSIQWNWAQAQLADARSRGQIVVVQFHHAPYSDGEHGLPMNHAQSSGQGGTPMRVYHPLFEQFGVAAVFSGHSEMFERSFVDTNADGVGVHYYDVGVSGDGLRGERRSSNGFGDNRLQYNPFSQWSADENSAEIWQDVNGVLQLIDGGKHYGHLEANLTRLDIPAADGTVALLTLTPVYSFPILDAAYNVIRTERRTYGDLVTLRLNGQGQVVPEPAALGLLGLAVPALARRRRD